MDCSPPGSSTHGILQARILEWVAMPSSMGSSPPVDRTPRLLCLLHRQADSLPLAPPGKPEARDPPKSPPDLTLPARLFLGSLLLPTSTSQCKKKSSVTVCPESEVAQLCPTLCDPVDCSLPHSSNHRIFQARVLDRVAISFSRGSSQPRDQTPGLIVGRCFTV